MDKLLVDAFAVLSDMGLEVREDGYLVRDLLMPGAVGVLVKDPRAVAGLVRGFIGADLSNIQKAGRDMLRALEAASK